MMLAIIGSLIFLAIVAAILYWVSYVLKHVLEMEFKTR